MWQSLSYSPIPHAGFPDPLLKAKAMLLPGLSSGDL